MTNEVSPDTRTHYWKAQINAWRLSGQSQQAFCKARDLNYPRFGYWLRKFRAQDQSVSGTTPHPPPSDFISVVAAPEAHPLSLHLPNGIELRSVTEQNLPLVEQLLARLR